MKHIFASLTLSLAMIVPASAEILVQDPYARVATPMARAGAAFMSLKNTGEADMRLIGVESDAAKRVEIHTHSEVDGVMMMRELEGGIAVPSGGVHMLKRGGDHIMFMGLAQRWAQDDMIPVTFIFENGDKIDVEIPVDLNRKPAEDHSGHGSDSN